MVSSNKLLRTVTYLVCLSLVSASVNQWNYNHLGPDIWGDYYPLCMGKSQSPINILTACTTYRDLEPFKFLSTNNGAYFPTWGSRPNTECSWGKSKREFLLG